MTKQDIIFLAAAQITAAKLSNATKPDTEPFMKLFLHWHRLLSEVYEATVKQTAQDR